MRMFVLITTATLLVTGIGCDGSTTSGEQRSGTNESADDSEQTTNESHADASSGSATEDATEDATESATEDATSALDSSGPDPEGDCTPECAGKTCGDDGCGATCGGCAAGQVCNGQGQCGSAAGCTDTCSGLGWSCDSVCGEACGVCVDGDVCQDGACSCAASCVGVECGDDGCGGTCGMCSEGTVCEAGSCVDEATSCTANCAGKECGPDGCGGTCGSCDPSEECFSGLCQGAVVCTVNCADKQCGDDGCGGSCGVCPTGQTCSATDQCQGEGVAGGASCQDTYNCLTQCGADEACMSQCQGLASAQALSELQALATCQAGCAAPDVACLAETCIVELAECFFDIHGASSCSDIITCLSSCASLDAGCQDGCINQGSLDAQADFMAVNVCLGSACPTQDQTCINSAAGPGGACESYVSTCLTP